MKNSRRPTAAHLPDNSPRWLRDSIGATIVGFALVASGFAACGGGWTGDSARDPQEVTTGNQSGSTEAPQRRKDGAPFGGATNDRQAAGLRQDKGEQIVCANDT